jgi:hypothetical protein
MAEREGFEPPIAFRLCLISSQVHSTGLCHLSAREPFRMPRRPARAAWSGRPGSNRRHSAWEADVLPLNYSRHLFSTGYSEPFPLLSCYDPFPECYASGHSSLLQQPGEPEKVYQGLRRLAAACPGARAERHPGPALAIDQGQQWRAYPRIRAEGNTAGMKNGNEPKQARKGRSGRPWLR